MPEEETCEYCLNIIDREKGKFKVLSHAKEGAPERIAHMDCYNKHGEEIRRPHNAKEHS
jgi:hypothetical protein